MHTAFTVRGCLEQLLLLLLVAFVLGLLVLVHRLHLLFDLAFDCFIVDLLAFIVLVEVEPVDLGSCLIRI